MTEDPILGQSLRCLRDHCHPEWGDRSPLDVFNRLLAKHIRPAGWTKNTHLNIRQEQIAARQELWSTEALAKLPRGHASSVGVDVPCPIVIAEYQGVLRLLDGNHRVNRWVEKGVARSHEVNILTIAGDGEFVTLPPATR